jgi:proliferating cell nuclear antigen
MKLVLDDASLLKDSISILSELVNEARFRIKKDAIELVAMDPANVAMVIFKLLSSNFSEYDVPKEQQLAINLAQFKQILKRGGANDTVVLEATADNKLVVQFRGESTRTFSLPIIELDEKEQKIPPLSFPVTITMPSDVLSEAIDDAGVVAESVSFIAQPDKLLVSAEGDTSKANIEIKSGPEISIVLDGKPSVRAKYSIEYLNKMLQGGKLADKVTVLFNQDYPLKLEYKVLDKLLLSFILAPRVEND